MRDWNPAWLAAIAATSLTAGLIDRFVLAPSDRHALLFAGLVLGTGLVTYRLLERGRLAWVATATAAALSLPYATHRHLLVFALLPLALLAIPNRILASIPRWETTLFGALVAGAASFALTQSWIGAVIGLPVAGLLLWVWPEDPTQGAFGTLWTLALIVPGALLLALVPLNAATGWLEKSDAFAALGFGIGLAALLALGSVAILGLSTLLASRSLGRYPAVLASIVGVAVLASVLPTKDIGLLQAGVSQLLAPVAVLASVCGGRLGARGGVWGGVGVFVPVGLALATVGLV